MVREDPYRRIDYRGMIAWESRLERELPFLVEMLGRPGPGPILDIGCGGGEHVRALASRGYRATGMDSSPAMLEQTGGPGEGVRFLGGDLMALPLRGGGRLGGAICLGNTLVHIMQDEEYVDLFAGLRDLLAGGAPLVIQILNYGRIRERGLRHLPLSFRTRGDTEIVFLRLIDMIDEKRVRFEVLSLERRSPGEQTRLVRSASTILRALRAEELRAFLERAGFRKILFFGSFGKAPYEPGKSPDVIAVARSR